MKTLDLLVHNALIADVVRLRKYSGWIGIRDGVIQYAEEGEAPADTPAGTTLDAAGQLLVPGLIDAHMHIESSLATPRRFAEAAVPHGTTAVLADPHELANVLGEAGVRYQLDAARGLPLRVFTAIPSCIPATDESIETALGTMDAATVSRLARELGVIALGELMDYQGLAAGSSRLDGVIAAAREAGLLLEGHTPTLGGPVLSDYASHGITSDHTLSTPEKLLEQLSKGFTVMLQEKSLNAEVIAAVLALPDRSRVLLVTDDVMPNRLLGGHLSRLLDIAVKLGLPPLEALACATLRPATYLRRPELGLIAPGRAADFSLLDPAFLTGDAPFRPQAVYVAGREVAREGRASFQLGASPATPQGGEITRGPLDAGRDLRFPLRDGANTCRVIAMNDANTFTALDTRIVRFVDGWPESTANLASVAVFQRQGEHAGAFALLANLGLREGAFATSLAHDSHNLLIVGRERESLARAVNLVISMGGGMAFCTPDRELTLPLPVAGLVSDAPTSEVAEACDRIESALRELGVRHRNPILFLTLLALTVSPAVKLSDKGLVDVEARKLIPLLA